MQKSTFFLRVSELLLVKVIDKARYVLLVWIERLITKTKQTKL